MSFALCYWILMLIWLVWGAWQAGTSWKNHGPNLLLFILLLLLGWRVFGQPLHQ